MRPLTPSAWIQAARPIAHPMIFIPLLLGEALFLSRGGELRLDLFLYTHLFGVIYQVFLLYVNDFADEHIDRTNEQFWLSGGSRVLPQGKLEARDLLWGSYVALASLVLLTLFLGLYAHRAGLVWFTAAAVGLCWAYNLKPLKWSYRGHGEVLQGLGCGVVLPLIGFYMQQGSIHGFPWWVLVPLYLVFHAGNLVTALPDYPSDLRGGKRTFPVRHGEKRARWTATALLALAYLSMAFLADGLGPTLISAVVLPPFAALAYAVLSGLIRSGDAANFSNCKAFVNVISFSQAWFLCAWTMGLISKVAG